VPVRARRAGVAEMTNTPIGLLRWRCRRGMRELDVLLERYLRERYPCAPEREQQAFEALLDLPDPQLHAYLMRREVPADPEWVHVIDQLSAVRI